MQFETLFKLMLLAFEDTAITGLKPSTVKSMTVPSTGLYLFSSHVKMVGITEHIAGNVLVKVSDDDVMIRVLNNLQVLSHVGIFLRVFDIVERDIVFLQNAMKRYTVIIRMYTASVIPATI